MTNSGKARVLVAGHDWGGLNILLPLLRYWREGAQITAEIIAAPTQRRDVLQLVPGQTCAPKIDMLDDWLSSNPLDLEAYLLEVLKIGAYDVVLCGTSAHALLERRLFKVAKIIGVPTVALCDMWWAYADRFREGAEWHLPDVLWVVDERMREAATNVVWPTPLAIDVVGSPLFGSLVERRRGSGRTKGGAIRFVSEPASTKYPEARIDEFSLADMIVTTAREIGLAHPIIIRPHPVDSHETWRRWIFARREMGVMFETLPIDEAIADTAMAVGISSILLTEMRMCGVPTASLQPAGVDPAYYCLPYRAMNIECLPTRESLAIWLRAPKMEETLAAYDVHVDAPVRITNRIFELARSWAKPAPR